MLEFVVVVDLGVLLFCVVVAMRVLVFWVVLGGCQVLVLVFAKCLFWCLLGFLSA